MKKIVICWVAFLVSFSNLSFFSWKGTNWMDESLLSLKQHRRLMIVAHPDDETIWGGEHLLRDSYVVVCLTNGDHEIRRNEFMQVMKASGNYGIILNYPDKRNGRRDDWSDCRQQILKQLKMIIDSNQWEIVVTHNPEGEYGHIHHKMTNQMVTSLMVQSNQLENLFYFDRYKKKNELSKKEKRMEEKWFLKKQELCQLYGSQAKVIERLSHQFPYENWISAVLWKNKENGS